MSDFARLLQLRLKKEKGKREARTRKKPNLTTLRVIREVICSICGFKYIGMKEEPEITKVLRYLCLLHLS